MNPTNEIDPDGDVIAIIPTTTTKFRVSSIMLSLASPVFRAMLSPRLHEGIQVTPASATVLLEVEFPDESPQALEAIFNVLHFRQDCMSANVSYDILYEIALVVDKYDLVKALGPWGEVWLRGAGGGGWGKRLFATYVFGDREGFRKECQRAILQSHGYDCNLNGGSEKGKETEMEEENDWDSNLVPTRVLELISEARISAIRSLLAVVEYFTDLYCNRDIKCRIYLPSPGPRAPRCVAIPGCDAGILGSLVTLYTTIGMRPTPQPPYKGFSVQNLALAIKGQRSSADQAHQECSIAEPVVRQVDEVLAQVDRLDIWNSCWGESAEDSHEEKRWRHGTEFKLAFLRDRT